MTIQNTYFTRFQHACDTVILGEKAKEGIGTLGEKTLHAVLKNYYEPQKAKQEIKIGNYYADIFNEKGIIEIQTTQFNKLRLKLAYFLKNHHVTIVYPIAYQKWIYWIDELTGEISGGRRSPKKGKSYEVFKELYKIKNFLRHEGLHIHVILVDLEEYRLLNGWSKDRKKGSHRSNRIPLVLQEELHIDALTDYQKFLPEELPKQFVCSDFAKAAEISLHLAQVSVNILLEVGVIKRVGKKGRAYLYEIA